MSDFLTWVGAGAGVVAAGLSWWQIRLSTKRSDVEWEAYKMPGHAGLFRVRNNGADTAFKVTITSWTSDEYGEDASKGKVKPGDFLLVKLPKREKYGPQAVELPPRTTPRVPDIPPSEHMRNQNPLFTQWGKEADAQWELQKKHQDAMDALHNRLKREGEESQVSIKVMWRSSRLGVWRSQDILTG